MSIPIVPLTHDLFDPWFERQPESTRQWVRAHGFRAQAGQTVNIPTPAGHVEKVLCGLGPRASLYGIAQLPASLTAEKYHIEGSWPDTDNQRLALGFELAGYRFSRYRENRPKAQLVIPTDAAGLDIRCQTNAVFTVRDLVNTPAEDMGPEQLSDAVKHLAEQYGGQFEAIVGEQLLKENLPAIHAVGRAASRAPRLLRLRWGNVDDPRLTLVGKGVCFDSGGLNLKGAAGMRWMKKDMGGAAQALGLAQLLMASDARFRIDLLIPAVENAVAGNAYRPGDVISTRAGKTVEIGNTDAEGRLVLADALALGAESEPKLMLDFATLTGAARIALGPDIVPLFCTHDGLARRIVDAGTVVEDPVWRMPLHDAYTSLLDSSVADLCNISEAPGAGCVVAALFLKQFVPPAITWGHLDVFAWNRSDRPGRPMGGEAHAIRAIFEVLRQKPDLNFDD